MALAGQLSAPGDASASAPQSRSVSGSCCLKVVCTACCCEPAGPLSRSEPRSHAAMVTPGLGGLATTAPFPCECRSNVPTMPAPKPAPWSDQKRTHSVRVELIGLVSTRSPADTFARLIAIAACPPRDPLYLRNARLLI
jgi:hypothetical protein